MEASSLTPDDLALELAGHLDFVRSMARALVRDEQIAEDVVQETMLAAIQHRPNAEAGLRVWLKSVLRRRVLLHFRTEQRRVARETLLVRDAAHGVAASESESARALGSFERTSTLGKAVAELSDPYRTVVLLRFFEGLPPREIATRLDRPVATVNTQLQRGLEKLRTSLDEENGGDRRQWIIALLPHALHGPSGWWPSSVGGVAGIAYGTIAKVAVMLLGLLAGAQWIGVFDLRADRPEPFSPSGEPVQDVAAAGEVSGSAEADGGQSETQGADTASRLPLGAEDGALRAAGEARQLRLTVRSADGVLEGASVVAELRFENDGSHRRVMSDVQGPAGMILTVHSTMVTRLDPKDGRVGQTMERGVTDADGVVLLPILDGERWTISVKADGFAPEIVDVTGRSQSAERTVTLEPAARIVLDRGTFPLEYRVYAQVRSRYGGVFRDALMKPGEQEVEIRDIEPGSWMVEVISDTGREVGHWYVPVTLERGRVTRVDVTKGGGAHTEIEVRDAVPPAVPHFANVQGPNLETGRPSWSQMAPVFNGIAHFHGLPPGPASVRIISWRAEIAHAEIEIQPRDETQRVELVVPSGEIRVLHPGVDGKDVTWHSAVRSGALDSQNGWSLRGDPMRAKEASWFPGCAPGTYRFWMTGPAIARRFDLEVAGEIVEVDAHDEEPDGSSRVGTLRWSRGAGVEPDAPLEVELWRGEWVKLESDREPDGSRVRLSRGAHRVRCALEGVGYAVRDVVVPGADSVTFEQDAAPQLVRLETDLRVENLRVEVKPLDPDEVRPSRRSLSFQLGADGAGSIRLRPGTYSARSRSGDDASFVVREGEATASITFL